MLRDDQAFVSFWRIIFDPDADITIYYENTGEILWEHQEQEKPQIIILGYTGIYSNDDSDDNLLYETINGNALFIKTKLISK